MVVYFLLRICAWIGSLCFAFTVSSVGIRPVPPEVGWTRPEGRSEEWDGVGVSVCEDGERAGGDASWTTRKRARRSARDGEPRRHVVPDFLDRSCVEENVT